MKPDRTVTNLRAAIKQLEAIAGRLTELKRRDTEQVGPDGYGSGAGDGTGRRSHGDHTDPTHSAAMGRKQHDPVHDLTAELIGIVHRVSDGANRAASIVALLDSMAEAKPAKPLFPICPVCDEQIRGPVRAGMDEACYRRWRTALEKDNTLDRGLWIRAERKRLTQPDEDVA